MEADYQPVSRTDAECLWASVRERASDPHAGIFGPSSISWKVNRESALFLGAGRAALLQLAHPWVAAALDQHSNLRNDPLARFHNTFRVVFTMIFGTLEQALAASRYLYQIHTRIQGAIPETVATYPKDSRYEANEANALLWVYATLVESALVAYECVLPPLSPGEREAYYSESKTLAALFGIPSHVLPATWLNFEAYSRGTIESAGLGVNDLSREMAHRVLQSKGTWVPVPGWYRALTTAWLPERLQEEFGLAFCRRERDAAAGARLWLPRIYGRLPATVRFTGPYLEAMSRVSGRGVGALTRTSNRFWMGQPRMMFAERGLGDAVELPQPLQ
ncbi:oxygenase MpaB family protein [Acidicapsa acidisoli]|uniref:oxygenase MpaB family protein n=1 Tax=Acidicapsa acidisoli TaxID=1615681 RepID=UPI0021DF8ED6|nr:oxygenase MpaB family protein [Acidicapsa acidisoli]